MTTLEAILIFAGLPTAIFGTIAALVFAVGPRRSPQQPEPPPVGARAQEVPCVIRETDDGRELHEAGAEAGAGADRTCWTVQCAECGLRYTEGADDVHFTGPLHGVSTVSAGGWRLAAGGWPERECVAHVVPEVLRHARGPQDDPLRECGAIVVVMDAAATRPPFAAATPAEIRAALVHEEQPKFDDEYRRALNVAAESFSLVHLDRVLESWRRIAWLCTDPDRYRRMWRRAALSYTGEASPRTSRCPQPSPEWAPYAVYCVATDERTDEQIAALPVAAISPFAEVRTLLEMQPWTGLPFYADIPASPVRILPFGDAEMITYLILDDLRRVELLEVLWAA